MIKILKLEKKSRQNIEILKIMLFLFLFCYNIINAILNTYYC